ncbi:hypothetical protein Pmani_007789 [Petrolisthes manimaculis]|uniref:WD repeat-containing protein 86 n=1 Tax=Petrolisthes manimaculis TaxID=1843537 RepID=A0AAE1Q6R0_9EUCA|nr:hypothetical protein Pmani_007789 [Petrolisthes manimaculis]
MGAAGTKGIRRFPRETQCDHDKGINCMAAAEDHSILATGSDDKTARVWDLTKDKIECLGVIKGHTDYITCITIHDTYVITGSADNTVRKWDAISCNCLYTYSGHECRVMRLLCTGEYVVSASNDHTVRAWHIDDEILDEIPESQACIGVFEGHESGVGTLAVVPSEVEGEGLEVGQGDILITGSSDSTARTWDFTTKKMIKKFVGHTNGVTCLAVDSSASLLYTGSSDKTVRCWDLQSAVCYSVMHAHQSHVVCLLALNKLLYSSDGAGAVHVWELKPREMYLALYTAQRKTFTRYQPKLVEPLAAIKQHGNTVNALLFHDGILYTACSDNLTRGFDVTNREMVAVFTGHKIAVTCMAICGTRLYTASTDTSLMVWDLAHQDEEDDDDDEDEDEDKNDDDDDDDDDDDE